jgi:hypothetical protein
MIAYVFANKDHFFYTVNAQRHIVTRAAQPLLFWGTAGVIGAVGAVLVYIGVTRKGRI